MCIFANKSQHLLTTMFLSEKPFELFVCTEMFNLRIRYLLVKVELLNCKK